MHTRERCDIHIDYWINFQKYICEYLSILIKNLMLQKLALRVRQIKNEEHFFVSLWILEFSKLLFAFWKCSKSKQFLSNVPHKIFEWSNIRCINKMIYESFFNGIWNIASLHYLPYRLLGVLQKLVWNLW